MSAEPRAVPAIATLLTSPDCLHPELPLTDKAEQSYLTQLATALAKGEWDDAAYGQCLTRLEAGNLSPAALYCFANLCYQHWQLQWPIAEALQTQQVEIVRQAAQLQAFAQGRTLFRRPGTPTRYYWGHTHSQTESAVEKGLFFACYPTFVAQDEGVNAIHHAELITDASQLTVCEAYTQAQRREQAFNQLLQHSSLLHQHVQRQGHHAQVIVNLQLAWLYYRSGRVVNSLSIHEAGQAVFYFRQAMGQLARQAFTQQQPLLPAALTTAAEQLRGLIDQALLDQAQQTLFTAQSAALLARWQSCYQEPALEAIYQLSQQTHALLTQAVSVPPAAKRPLLDAWFAGFNRGAAGEDEQEVRIAMHNAVTRACNPVQKYPHSLATVHQWLLTLARQLQQHGATDRARALLHAYQPLLIRKRPNLQQTIASTDQGKAPYTAILATCEQALTELDQWLTDSTAVADSKTAMPQAVSTSAFAKRHEQLHTWRQTLAQSLAANTKAGDIYTTNTQFARNLLADICREIEQQIGSPPCAYTLLGAGSFGRGEISPASDVDCALLVAEDAAKTHPWFRCFLQLLQWKLASLPAGILSLERETLAWINKGYWFDTPAGFIEQHLASQQPHDPSSLQQPENFGAQWFRWIYSSGNQSQEKDMLFADYQKQLHTFFHTPIGTNSLPAYQQLAPWSLNQHIGQAVTPSHRQLSLGPVSIDASATEAKSTAKESKHEVNAGSSPASTTNTFAVLNVKNLSYRLINAILCYGRFYDVPSGITTTRDVLAYLKQQQCLPVAFIARLETALDQLYTWRLRQHWAWLHHSSELGENEVMLWPEDFAQQAVIAALPEGWRGFYLDKTETEHCWAIVHHTAEVIGRSVEGFTSYASRIPATITALQSERAKENNEAKGIKREADGLPPPSSSYTTTTPAEVKEVKREVSEEQAQAILAAQTHSIAVAEAKGPTPPPAMQTFNPLAAAVTWTLQQLAKPKDDKISTEADQVARAMHVQWLARVMGQCAEELPVTEPHHHDPARVKQDLSFRKHWQVYWAVPTAWRGAYIEQLRHSLSAQPDTILEPLINAPNKAGWRLSAQRSEQQWQQALRALFAAEPQPSLPPDAKSEIAQGKAMWVSWVEQDAIRWAPLRQECASVLIDAKQQCWQPQHNVHGNHRLYALQTPSHSFWVKAYPEQPGTEYLVTALDRRLGVNGTFSHQLMALHHAPLRVPDGTPQGMQMQLSAILLSQHVADAKYTLHRCVKKEPQLVEKLDFLAFAKTLLRVLLTNPEDDKGSDYFLVPLPGADRYQLIRIDNERAFLPVTHLTQNTWSSQKDLQVKSILYCLDQMLLPWSSDPRTAALLHDLHQLQPALLVLDILQDIEQQQRCWQQLFPKTVVERHACLQDPWMSLPVFLLPQGLESALLKRLSSLQTALRLLDPAAITGLKLLELVQPKLAQYYHAKLFQGKLARNPHQPQAQVWARFDQVAGRYYRQHAASAGAVDNQVSLHSGPAIYSRQLSLALPELPKTGEERTALMAFAYSIWSQQAHSVKQALQGAQHWQHLQAVAIGKGLLALRPDAQSQFGWLPAREQQQILDQLLSPQAVPLTPQQQQFLLSALVGAQCHDLDFRPFKAVLTNKLLVPVLQEADKQIIRLNLSDCTQLTADILKDIERYCPYLKRLQLNGQTTWKRLHIGNFAELTTVECNQATTLTDIRFGQLPNLKKLSLANATKLEVLANQGLGLTATTQAWPLPQLQQLDTQNSPLLRLVHIQTDQPHTLNWQWQGCIALKVPSLYFSWMQELPAGVDKLIKTFRATPPLAKLDLSASSIEDTQVQVVAELLKANTTLTALDLGYNSRGEAGKRSLGVINAYLARNCLLKDPALTTLSLGGRQLGEGGAQVLAELLKTNTTLASLNLSSSQLGEAGAQALAEALKTNTTLTTLDLQYNSLGDAGAQALAEALKTNTTLTTLTTLDLSWNQLGNAGAQTLAELLKTNTVLTTLDLSWNPLDDAGVQALAEAFKINTTLTTLRLYSNQLGDAGAQALAEALKINTTLTTLALSSNQLGEARKRSLGVINAYLARNRLLKDATLTSLNLDPRNPGNNPLGDAGAQLLAKALKIHTALTTLDLRHNQLGDAGAQVLAELLKTNTTLTSLNLYDNQLGEAGVQTLAEALKTNTTLTELDLRGNQLGNAGKRSLGVINAHLARNRLCKKTRPSELDLYGNQLGDAGAQVLAELLKTNTTLTKLGLRGDQLSNAGVQALTEALKTNTTLTELDLGHNQLGGAGAQALAEALKTNTTFIKLYLSSNQLGDTDAQVLAEALKINTTLTELNLGHNQLGGAGVQALAEALKINTTLTRLDLGHNPLGEVGAQALAEALKTNTILTRLDLSYDWQTKLKEETRRKIEEYLTRNRQLQAEALADTLKANATPTTLDLSYKQLGNAGAQALAEALKTNTTLTTLNLKDNQLGDTGVQALAELLKTNTTLTALDLDYYNPLMGEAGKQSLGVIDAYLARNRLQKDPTLTRLDLSYKQLGEASARVLAEALKTNTALTALNLSNNKLGDAGAQLLAEALKTNTTLTKLNLRDNQLGDAGAQLLAEALKTNATLTALNLSLNGLGGAGAQALAEALKTNTTLTKLNLRDNQLGDAGAQLLAEALKTNTTLTSLDLYGNQLSDAGAQALAEALKTNIALTTLNLSFNWLGDAGAQVLAEALKTNTTLTSLDLGWNRLGEAGVLVLAEALKTNTTLTSLDLRGSRLGDASAQALAEALKTNTALTKLDLYGNQLGDAGREAEHKIKKYLARNRQLQEAAKAASQPKDSKLTQSSLLLPHKKGETKGMPNAPITLPAISSSLEGSPAVEASSHTTTSSISSVSPQEHKVEVEVEAIAVPPFSPPLSVLPAPHSQFFQPYAPADEKAQILLEDVRNALDRAYPPNLAEHHDTRNAYLTQVAEYKSRAGMLNQADRNTLRQLLKALEEAAQSNAVQTTVAVERQ